MCVTHIICWDACDKTTNANLVRLNVLHLQYILYSIIIIVFTNGSNVPRKKLCYGFVGHYLYAPLSLRCKVFSHNFSLIVATWGNPFILSLQMNLFVQLPA